jgi:predicted RNA binding protein YcfA (HicA-like mRNA interferase family)
VARLPTISGSRLVKALKKIGFRQIRQKGSYVSLEKATGEKGYRTVVPLHRSLAKGTLSDILRQCGISKERLKEML